MHCIVFGAFTSGLVFATSSWQEAQLRWNACWLVSVMRAALDSCLICGISGQTVGFVVARAWQLRHAMTPTADWSFSKSSAVRVVVRSSGQAVLSGGVFATSEAGCAVWRHSMQATGPVPRSEER